MESYKKVLAVIGSIMLSVASVGIFFIGLCFYPKIILPILFFGAIILLIISLSAVWYSAIECLIDKHSNNEE